MPSGVAARRILAVPLLAAALWAGGAVDAADQRITLRTDDGVMLAGTWYEPAERPAPAVILVHMLNRSRREWDAAARHLASAGIGALAIDLRGHGESGGGITPSDPAQPDYGALVLDVRAARRYLAQRAGVQQSRVGMAGASLGANLAALEASADPSIAAVALLSPSLDYRGLRIEAAVRKLGERRILLVASDDDPYAVRSAKELQKGSPGTRDLWILKSAGHGTAMLTRDPDLLPALVDWFRRTLL
jgi:alpha-beta hydrolase superfamily lysophospholipase